MKDIFLVVLVILVSTFSFGQTNENCDFNLPNLFSTETNDDGESIDVLRIEFPCDVQRVQFVLYDRRGKSIIEHDDFIENNLFEITAADLKPQTYIYEMRVLIDGEETVKKGMIQNIRR